MRAETRSHAFLLGCSLIWGFTFVAQRLGAEHLGAFAFNAARGYLGVVALLPLIRLLDARVALGRAERRAAWRAALVPGVLVGLMLTGGQTLQQLGVERTTAGHAAFITGLYMVLVPLAGVLFGQRTTLFTWLGIALAVPGLFLLTWSGGSIGVGDLMVLAATGFWTFQILGVGHYAGLVDPVRLSLVQFGVMAVVSHVVALVAEPDAFAGLVPALGAVFFAGVLSTGVAFTLQVLGQRHAKASIAAMIMSLEALWGAVGGALFLGERLTASGCAGAALMMAGILLAQVSPRSGRAGAGVTPVPEPPATSRGG